MSLIMVSHHFQDAVAPPEDRHGPKQMGPRGNRHCFKIIHGHSHSTSLLLKRMCGCSICCGIMGKTKAPFLAILIQSETRPVAQIRHRQNGTQIFSSLWGRHRENTQKSAISTPENFCTPPRLSISTIQFRALLFGTHQHHQPAFNRPKPPRLSTTSDLCPRFKAGSGFS